MNQTDFSLDALLSNPTVLVILQAISGLSFIVALAIVWFSYVKGNTEIIIQVSINLTLSLLVHFALVAQYILKKIKTVREWLTAYFDVLNAASNQPDKKTIPIVFYCSWNAVWKTPFLFLTSHWINLQERYQIIIIVFNIVTIIFNIIQAKPTKERTRKIKIFKRLMGLNTVEVYAPNPQAFENPLPKSNRAKNIEERKREEQKI
ncbi:hypothetical protein CAEBREN_24779 [Caenorhabditis brenneri]|uniref:Uncharacterized protein n=1 Tax=Caenorhabditis brenneri TaxID=135651 RepID=G0M7J5_CAEBE|nr:hypothetical protein CAEBREN_24779 [Caenorhabditis brenneri]